VTGLSQKSIRFDYAFGVSINSELDDTESEPCEWWVKTVGSRGLWSSVLDTWLESVPATDVDEAPVRLLIPHAVIFQAYFASSSALIRAVLRNELERYESAGQLSSRDGHRVGEVAVRPGWTDLDVLFAARLLGSARARRAVNLVHSSLIEAIEDHRVKRRSDPERALPLRTCLPFEGASEMTVRYVDVPNSGVSRTLLVHEILSCNGPTELEQIVQVRQDRPPRERGAHEVSPEADPMVRRSALVQPDATVVEDSEPSSTAPAVTHRRGDDRFAAITSKFERARVRAPGRDGGGGRDGDPAGDAPLEGDPGTGRPGGRTVRLEVEVTSAGTGQGSTTGTSHGLRFLDVPEPNQDPPAFQLAVRAAEALERTGNVRFEPVGVVTGVRVPGLSLSPAPSEVVAGGFISNVDWAVGLVGGWPAARRILVLELESAGRHVYVVEIERLDGDEGRYQMAMLMHPLKGVLQPQVLQNVLNRLAVARGVWGATTGIALRIKRMNHVRNQKPEALAARWIGRWCELDAGMRELPKPTRSDSSITGGP
jgi:hypothetical protein